jgi:peptidylprolyl isomerase
MVRALLACSLLVLSACGEPDSGEPEKISYDSRLGVDLGAMARSPSGLYTQDLVTGTGDEAVAGRGVAMRYTGWLPEGVEFDSNASSTERPFWFTLGQGRVIAGWEEGVVGMKVGGKRKLVIPSRLAYGAEGVPPVIPPHAVLVFDVELIAVR